MLSIGRRMFSNVTRYSARSGGFGPVILAFCRPRAVRTLSTASHCCAKSQRSTGDVADEPLSQPIKFSTSKASHRCWTVDRSMGSIHQRPWWRVLPLSFLAISFLLWCILRSSSEVDQALDKQLYEHLPELLTIMETEDDTTKSIRTPEDGFK